MKPGVPLLAQGAPERLEEVPTIPVVRSERPPAPPRVVEEVTSRYQAIRGSSPVTEWTRVPAGALEEMLGLPVCYGMRNSHPFIQVALDSRPARTKGQSTP